MLTGIKGRSICKIVNSLVSNFASVLFDFDLRQKLVKQTEVSMQLPGMAEPEGGLTTPPSLRFSSLPTCFKLGKFVQLRKVLNAVFSKQGY